MYARVLPDMALSFLLHQTRSGSTARGYRAPRHLLVASGAVPPALIVLVDDPDETDPTLLATLDLARRVGGVGRVLLFHPDEAESKLTSRSLGYRLWPQTGSSAGERYANAFRQA